MFESNVFVKSEMEVRSNRIRNGVAGSRRGRVRVPRVRRPAEASDNAR